MLNIRGKFDSTIYALIEKFGYLINPLILNFINENNRILIFYFHGIYKSKGEKELNHVDPQNNITISQFSQFIDYFLQLNYRFIKPEDLVTTLPEDQPYVMITFDDGYFNNILALEILKKYKIPAVFFITTLNVLENKCFWWDTVYKYRAKEGKSLTLIRKEQAYLKNFKHQYIEEYILQSFGKNCSSPWSEIDRPFNCHELENFSKNPFTSIGNHTHNHSILINYNDNEIKEEFIKSNKILENIIGTKPISVAFPNGNFNQSVLNAAREMEFLFAFTTQNHINILPNIIKDEIILLNRFMMKTKNIKKFGSFNRLGYNPETLYYNLKKIISFGKK